MRNTKAKKLRRKAEEMTVGFPDVAYVTVRHRKRLSVLDSWGEQKILTANCTRSVYQNLKKSA